MMGVEADMFFNPQLFLIFAVIESKSKMDHPVNIKFGEVNNLSDARYAAALGATFLGFNLSPNHPQYITPELLKEISGWAAGPSLVSEWENEVAEVISDTCKRLTIEYVQLNRFDPKVTEALKQDFSVIQNIEITAADVVSDIITRINQVNGLVMYYMLSFPTMHDQEVFLSNPSHKLLLTDCCRDYPVLLNFHFTPQNLVPIIEEFKPFGINLRGSSEIKPGYKDFEELNELITLLEPGH
jgi:phosphoribosylanthranilate isomerase